MQEQSNSASDATIVIATDSARCFSDPIDRVGFDPANGVATSEGDMNASRTSVEFLAIGCFDHCLQLGNRRGEADLIDQNLAECGKLIARQAGGVRPEP